MTLYPRCPPVEHIINSSHASVLVLTQLFPLIGGSCGNPLARTCFAVRTRWFDTLGQVDHAIPVELCPTHCQPQTTTRRSSLGTDRLAIDLRVRV